MVSEQLLTRVVADVSRHVRVSKGYEEESFINPLTPVDSVASFAMAKLLTETNAFDICVSVAPEGHVYGYFFQLFGASSRGLWLTCLDVEKELFWQASQTGRLHGPFRLREAGTPLLLQAH